MIAFDYSMSSPAMCFKTAKDEYEIHFINPKKKYEGTYQAGPFKIVGHYYDHKKENHDDIRRFGRLAEIFLSVLPEQEDKEASFEAYAFGAKGMLANIGECTGIMKHELAKRGYTIRTLSPTTVKKYASGSGSADKDGMGEAFQAIHQFYVHDLIGVTKMKDSPASDVVDAYFVLQTGLMERTIIPVEAKPKLKPKGKKVKKVAVVKK